MADKPNIFQRLLQWIRGLSKLQLTALIALIVVLCIGTASALYYRHLSNMDKVFDDIDWGNGSNEDDSPDLDATFSGEKIINIALLGHDNNKARSKKRVQGYTGLVDTIMVAAINLDTAEVNLVSIPRDSLVTIYNHGSYKDKINSANYWGWRKGLPGVEDDVEAGLITQVETISSVLGGVPIHYYFSVDLDAVAELVDVVGGVWYDVPNNVYAKDGRVLVEKGYQQLDGRKFLFYVRNRRGSSDFHRAGNQQDILLSAFSQFKKAKTLVYAPQALLSLKSQYRTNLSIEQIMALALFASKEVNASNISTHVLAGRYESGGIPGRRESLPYYLLDHPKRVKLIEEIWGKVVEPGPPDKLLPPLKEDDPPGDPSQSPSTQP